MPPRPSWPPSPYSPPPDDLAARTLLQGLVRGIVTDGVDLLFRRPGGRRGTGVPGLGSASRRNPPVVLGPVAANVLMDVRKRHL